MNIPVENEYYWIQIKDEILVGYFTCSYGFCTWSVCGTEEIFGTEDVIILSHVDRMY